MAELREPTRRPRGTSIAQCLIVAALGMVAVLLAGALLLWPSGLAAQTAPGSAAGSPGRVFAVAGQLTRDSYGLYLLDLQSGTICVYEYVGGSRPRLHMRAARTFIYDRRLDSFNTEPAPARIAELVNKARRLKDVTTHSKP